MLLCMALALPANAWAQDVLDDVLDGFDKAPKTVPTDDPLEGFDEPSSSTSATEHSVASPWSVSGSMLFSAAYDYTQNTPTAGSSDKRGLSRARPKANLKIKGNLPDQFSLPVRVLGEASVAHDFVYAVHGRGDYNATVLNSFERDINLGELYASAQLGNGFEITAGRQTIVWGTSENLRVVDVINPLDRRELGMVDIEDVRLPLAMVRADYTAGPWSASALVIPHIRFNKTAPSYSPYDTANGAAPQNDVPSGGLNNTELAARLKGTFSGWDLSLHAANLYDDNGHKETVNGATRIRHERVNMVGISGDIALGNWLVRGEAASFSGLQTLGVPGQDFTRHDILAGVDYTGLSDASMSFEVVNRHLVDWSPALIGEGLKRNSQEYALRYSGDYMHDRVHLTALTTRISPLTKGGGFSRASIEYDVQDALSITGGITLYHDGTRAPFKGLGDNDRIFVEIKQSF
ncbi:hypothetical protein BEN30_02405 [Magnetovibrio blakemorei]|uniref:Porin domain-containing protein n=1 Tax=Magnetovibrio blakemorei TaxID=28181 RepID=A0A1E5QCA2_9PROT|nr:hypothetical protein BEN30_02405 [Magnetovibrio blakemorei]